MKNLTQILRGIKILEQVGDLNQDIVSIVFDSRKVELNCLFVAVRGTQVDGHSFIAKAILGGAKVIICEEMPVFTEGVTFVKVADAAAALGEIAANFYDNPTKNLKVVGITGTNGKTSTATLLYDLFTGLGYKCGLVSTVEYSPVRPASALVNWALARTLPTNPER